MVRRHVWDRLIRKIGWGVMTVLALLIALDAVALLFVPAMRAPFLRDRFISVPLAAFLHRHCHRNAARLETRDVERYHGRRRGLDIDGPRVIAGQAAVA